MSDMARPLRIERPGGRYHITARGNERKAVYRDDSDRFHFLELLSEAVGQAISRFGKRVQSVAEVRRNLRKTEIQLSIVEM